MKDKQDLGTRFRCLGFGKYRGCRKAVIGGREDSEEGILTGLVEKGGS